MGRSGDISITQDYVKSILSYDEDTGLFTWRKSKRNAGWLHDKGHSKKYWRIEIDGRAYYRSRLAWLYVNGEMPNVIDHINQNSLDDRIENLRNVTQYENMKNLKLMKSNTSGVCGVHFERSRRKWRAVIRSEGKCYILGEYKDKFEAICARKSAEIKYGFHPNHGS